jgi:hypothetical protein
LYLEEFLFLLSWKSWKSWGRGLQTVKGMGSLVSGLKWWCDVVDDGPLPWRVSSIFRWWFNRRPLLVVNGGWYGRLQPMKGDPPANLRALSDFISAFKIVHMTLKRPRCDKRTDKSLCNSTLFLVSKVGYRHKGW